MLIIPDNPGTYILILRTLVSGKVKAGRLGEVMLVPGFLAYAGSALGGGGLRARIRRHMAACKKPNWHIDYIRPYTLIDEIWFCTVREKMEHQAASAIQSLPEASVAADRFGSSDCGCRSHLFRFERKPSLNSFRNAFRERAGASQWESSAITARPRLLISKCLTGYNCRYNGEPLTCRIMNRLSSTADLIEVCPEMEIGLPVPRRPVNIVISDRRKKLIQDETDEDLTARMVEFSSHFIDSTVSVSGLIMKGRSPSCGIGNTPVHGKDVAGGSGFFASAFMERRPDTPAANIEDLQDPDFLRKFLAAVLSRSARMRDNLSGFSADPLVELWIRGDSASMARYLLGSHSD